MRRVISRCEIHTLGGHAVVRVRDSGISLALVRTLVELHAGSVTAVSAGLGQGSEFTVRLPEDNKILPGQSYVRRL